MNRTGEVSYLKERLQGPILPEIIDPKDYDIEDIMKSYFLEILFLARRYVRPAVDYEDLVNEGIIGLLDAIDRFDIGKANSNPRAFHNLAIVRIKSFMFVFFLNNNTQYSVPNYMARAMNLLEQIRNIIEGASYLGDSRKALLEYHCEEFDDAVSATTAKKLNTVKSKLQRLANGSNKTYEEMALTVLGVEENIRSYENEGVHTDVSPEDLTADREYLEQFLGNLRPGARTVLTALLNGNTLEQAGNEISVSRERARQIGEKAVEHLLRTPMYRDAVGEKQ